MSAEGEEKIELETEVHFRDDKIRSSGCSTKTNQKVQTREKFANDSSYRRVDPKYEYNVRIEGAMAEEILNENICLKFLMPRCDDASIKSSSEYEKPGRVTAYCNLNMQQLLKDEAFHGKGKKIEVFSEAAYFDPVARPLGEIQVRCNFLADKAQPLDLSSFIECSSQSTS